LNAWFESWFGEDYLRLYPHRDEADAGAVISLISKRLDLAGKNILDLACGSGRHLVPLKELGGQPVGLDLSETLLHIAATAQPGSPLVRGDMRTLPFQSRSFDVVVNLFTSFGYFDDDASNSVVLAEISRVIVPGGTFVLDYLNADHVVSTLVSSQVVDTGKETLDVTRTISDDGRFVIKKMRQRSDGRTFTERVRLLSASTLDSMITTAGFTVREVYGDYEGNPIDADSSRAILMSTKR